MKRFKNHYLSINTVEQEITEVISQVNPSWEMVAVFPNPNNGSDIKVFFKEEMKPVKKKPTKKQPTGGKGEE